jgi:methylated-DNA-[protein]-cysteine S-methyltransferase
MVYGSLYETARGIGGVVANESGLVAVILPDPVGKESVLAQMRQWHAELQPLALSREAAELLRHYFAGEAVQFALPIDDRHWSAFGRAVYHAVMAIPYGEVRSYGAIATSCGCPGAARAVGRLMASNRLPIIIPCHRVVAANGALTGYSAPGGVPFKEELLQMEGVSLKDGQRVCW